MNARTRMTMRCSSERQAATDERDAFNQPVTAPMRVLDEHPCYWQSRSEDFIANGDKLVSVAVHTLLLPLGSDIEEQDVITAVRDRIGRDLKTTRMRVLSALAKEGQIEARLEEYA